MEGKMPKFYKYLNFLRIGKPVVAVADLLTVCVVFDYFIKF